MITRQEAAVTIYRYTKFVKDEESTLSIVLKGQMLIEGAIESLIHTVYTDSSVFNLTRMVYPQKLDLLVAIGVFQKEDILPYKKLNDIRRKYAHNLNYELKSSDLDIVKETLSKKHIALFQEGFKEQEEDIKSLLKIIILHLLTLIIYQNSKDVNFNKTPIEPLTIDEIKFYRDSALKTLEEESLNNIEGK